ncbi:putative phage protein (TIGR02218 family) [Sinorhizobium fredii]|uniref:phage BR0599 family protein n=1 Tax=Rhizobium fredii TaxID=380 RepID=UPI0035198FC0
MSYDAYETSVDTGSPYFLYLFDNGVTPERLTSEPEALTRVGESWTPSPVSHGDLEQTGDIEKSSLDLTFPLSNSFARTFLTPAAAITTVTIWRGHRDDMTETLRVVWKGRAVGAKDRGNEIVVSVESVFTSMRRTGCRARYQRTCRHALYFPGCDLDRAAFEVAGTVTSVDGLVLTIAAAAAAADGDYAAGIVNFGGVMGFVARHVGNQVTLLTAIAGLAETVAANGSATVLLAPGCNLTRSRCNSRFNNGLNFGGFDRMPDNNPFSISIV